MDRLIELVFQQQKKNISFRRSYDSQGLNFTNFLRAAFLYETFVLFCGLHLRFDLFLAQEYWRKCAHKMLVKLTKGIRHFTLTSTFVIVVALAFCFCSCKLPVKIITERYLY